MHQTCSYSKYNLIKRPRISKYLVYGKSGAAVSDKKKKSLNLEHIL